MALRLTTSVGHLKWLDTSMSGETRLRHFASGRESALRNVYLLDGYVASACNYVVMPDAWLPSLMSLS